jgi:lycopene cyclase domain-containing protein
MSTVSIDKSVGPNWPRYLLLLLPYIMVALQWGLDEVKTDNLVYEVPKLGHWSFLESHWTYAYLHIFTLVPVFFLSFDKKVAYYRFWPTLFPAIFIVGGLFIIWDVYKTAVGVWGFNYEHLQGWNFLGLPWEEWLFFVTVPYASIFIYACLNAYFPGDPLRNYDKPITFTLIGLWILGAIFNLDRMYTATTFLLAAGFLLYHYIYVPNTYRSRFYRAYAVILIPFLLVNGILTGAMTENPVVVYNPEEFMGIRVVSVPIEDSAYGFLHLFGVCFWMEWLLQRNKAALAKKNA